MTAIRKSRVPQQRIAESIAAELRDRILDNPDGMTLSLPTQDQLVEEFGVSHPSVREAIRILETEGLVTVRRGNVGGAEVHRPDELSAAYHIGLVLQGGRVTIGDLATSLQHFEPMCAAECARRTDRMDTVVPALRANLQASAEVRDSGPEFTQTAREFHDQVVAFTPNDTTRYVVGSLVALWTAQETIWAEATSSRGDYPIANTKDVLKVHQRMTDEIEAGRADEAARVAQAHLVATQALLHEHFGQVIRARSTRFAPRAKPGASWRV